MEVLMPKKSFIFYVTPSSIRRLAMTEIIIIGDYPYLFKGYDHSSSNAIPLSGFKRLSPQIFAYLQD